MRLIDSVTLEVDVDTVDGDGQETFVLRNHDAIQVSATWTRCGEGRLVHGASLLQVGSATGTASFSVASGGLTPCSTRGSR